MFGIVLGIIQFRASRPFSILRVGSYIPYSGWMRWHYITGAVFGVFTLTWAFSGLLSMDPWEWVSGEDLRISREAFSGGKLDFRHYPPFDVAAWPALTAGREIKEIELMRIQGDPYYLARLADSERLLVSANPLRIRRDPFGTDSLVARLKQAVPDPRIVDVQLLADYDSYYYSRDEQKPLPILRLSSTIRNRHGSTSIP